jgi:CBS domain-containing protein
MLRLRDIMTTDLAILHPDVTLEMAIDLLAARHVSGAPVVAGGTVVGVISTSDILSFAATTPPPSFPFPDAEPNAWVEGDDPPGSFFSDLWNDDGADVAERMADPTSLERNRFAESTVGEVMTRALVTMPASASVEEAARVMRDSRIHRVLVMDDDELAGIVSVSDINAAVADGRLTTIRYVFPSSGRGPT